MFEHGTVMLTPQEDMRVAVLLREYDYLSSEILASVNSRIRVMIELKTLHIDLTRMRPHDHLPQ
jgi:hypothetical protein